MSSLPIPYRISYAQNREDIFLEYFFRDTKEGFYVDVGANDPVEHSVTKLFYDKGWRGINVEPIKRLHAALEAARPRDINLNIGVSSKPGTTKFREFHEYHGLSTMSPEMHEQYRGNESDDAGYADYTDHEVKLDTLTHIFEEHGVTSIQFMKVDVEGYEYDALAGNDWDKFRPQIICIEANHITKDWRPLLLDNRYKKVFNDGLNDYYVSEESADLGDQFSYVQAILPSPVLSNSVVDAIDEAVQLKKDRVESILLQNSELSVKISEVEHKLRLLERELSESRRFKVIVRSLLVKIDSIVQDRIFPLGERTRLQAINPSNKVQLYDSVEQQREAIDAYDKENLSRLGYVQHPYRSRLLEAYMVVRSVMRSIISLSLRVVKKIKRTISR